MILENDYAINKIESEKLKFLTFVPRKIHHQALTLRVNDRKWDTVRYFLTVDGIELRIKEFFMDWFYTGFPKSLLSNFIGTYSQVYHASTKNGIMFYGKNYRGNDSASMNIMGTQIEIESTVSAPMEVFRSIVEDLIPYKGVKFDCSLPFHERSFFAAGKHGDWFEDERISRMKWKAADGSAAMKIHGSVVRASSTGSYGNGEFHRIVVLENNCFSHVSWIDFCTYPNNIVHSFYKLRNEGSLFDTFIIERDRKYVFRGDSGPALYQFYRDGKLYTVSFSPGIPVIDPEEVSSMEEEFASVGSLAFSSIQ
ncbi:MAG: hypothetical protein ACYCSA_04275 [Thermoplasmataceae archaeon]